jgi:hypothetical protein
MGPAPNRTLFHHHTGDSYILASGSDRGHYGI